MAERRVLLFVKWPEPGRVKTRLAADVGEEGAAALYRAFVADELAALREAGEPVVVCFDPAPAHADEAAYRSWLGADHAYLCQRGPDLGARMAAAFEDAFAAGADEAVLIGSDIPALEPQDIRRAFAALGRHGAALAPSGDGGYTLVGFTRRAFLPQVFNAVPWSTPEVWDVTLARFGEAGRRPELLPRLPDADTAAALAGQLPAACGQGRPFAGRATLAAWRALGR